MHGGEPLGVLGERGLRVRRLRLHAELERSPVGCRLDLAGRVDGYPPCGRALLGSAPPRAAHACERGSGKNERRNGGDANRLHRFLLFS